MMLTKVDYEKLEQFKRAFNTLLLTKEQAQLILGRKLCDNI